MTDIYCECARGFDVSACAAGTKRIGSESARRETERPVADLARSCNISADSDHWPVNRCISSFHCANAFLLYPLASLHGLKLKYLQHCDNQFPCPQPSPPHQPVSKTYTVSYWTEPYISVNRYTPRTYITMIRNIISNMACFNFNFNINRTVEYRPKITC